MPRFTFAVELQGYGDTPEEAWRDAVQGFTMDPGVAPNPSSEEETDDEAYEREHRAEQQGERDA